MTLLMYLVSWVVIFIGGIVLLLLLGGCTFVTPHNWPKDPIEANVCVYVAQGVTQERVDDLMAGVGHVHLVPVHTREWSPFRGPNGADDILASLPAPGPDCRWSLGFLQRQWEEAAIAAVFGFEVLGAADEIGGKKAYVITDWRNPVGSLMSPPGHTLKHEILHLLGAKHFRPFNVKEATPQSQPSQR